MRPPTGMKYGIRKITRRELLEDRLRQVRDEINEKENEIGRLRSELERLEQLDGEISKEEQE